MKISRKQRLGGLGSIVYFTIVLATGWILYALAILHNKDENLMLFLPFVILSSLSFSIITFAGYFNVQGIFSELAKENKVFMCFTIAHFIAAVAITSLYIVKNFGKNIINRCRVFSNSRSLSEKYIVIGCSRKTELFLKNFKNETMTVILQSNETEKETELINRGYAVVSVKEIKKDEKDTCSEFYESLKRSLEKAGAMRCNGKVKIVSIEEKNEINLSVGKIMADYVKEQKSKTSEINLDVYIMYDFLERTEHFYFIENTAGKIRFFNTYEIMARKLLWEKPITKLIPQDWINTQKARLKRGNEGGKDKYKISSIFIGFGGTNKAILKTSIVNNQLLDVDYNALVISKDAKEQEKIFRNSAIGLFDETDESGKITKHGAEIKQYSDHNGYLNGPDEKNIIVFKEADALSIELYDLVIQEISNECDYATFVIALGNDKLSVETALELRQKLYETDLLLGKTGDPKVRIFVKISAKTIYNDGKILNGGDMANKINCNIETFGADEEVLTKEYLIDEKLDVLAKNINGKYNGSAESEAAWCKLKQFKRESNRYAAMAIKVKLNLLGFDLKNDVKEDRECKELFDKNYGTNAAFNLRKKRKELEDAIKNKDKNLLTLITNEVIDLVEREENGIEFSDNARNNLAKLEHQRWNAFHLANDWTKLPIEKIGMDKRQDEVAKQHACITNFDGLINLREIQKNKKMDTSNNVDKYTETKSLLEVDTIRYDFDTMDFLLDRTDENSDEKYTGILTGSGYHICFANLT